MIKTENNILNKNDAQTDVAQNFLNVLAHMQRACTDANREQNSVKLIAVSKTHSFEHIEPVITQGHCCFGENYVQEAEKKWDLPRKNLPNLELHLVGPLQSNKVRQAIELFDVIHSLDRVSLAKALAKEFEKTTRHPTLFIQVNTGEEPQKGGIIPSLLPDFLNQCRNEYGLKPTGLMCIPPAHEAPSSHFALFEKLAERHDLPNLSMGMSDDFEAAIQMGATHIRVGSAIFGARHYVT